MYDKFPPFKAVEKQSIVFHPYRYEIWMNGQLVKKGKTSASIKVDTVKLPNESDILLRTRIKDKQLSSEIINEFYFDLFFTAHDRLMLATVTTMRSDDPAGLRSLQQIFPMNTRNKKFLKNEPFCCSLFLLNGCIDKMTFSFGNPDKLIEFYSN